MEHLLQRIEVGEIYLNCIILTVCLIRKLIKLKDTHRDVDNKGSSSLLELTILQWLLLDGTCVCLGSSCLQRFSSRNLNHQEK